MPMTIKNKRKATLDASMEEVDRHIKKLVEHFGPFTYPPVKTPYNPHKEEEQLQLLFPGYLFKINFELFELIIIG